METKLNNKIHKNRKNILNLYPKYICSWNTTPVDFKGVGHIDRYKYNPRKK